MNLKISEEATQGLLEIVVEERKLADGVVQAEYCGDERYKSARRKHAVGDLIAAYQQKKSDSDGAEYIHQRRRDCCRCDGAQVGPEKPPRGLTKTVDLPVFAAEGFYDAVAGNGFVQNVLNLGSLSCPRRVVWRTRWPIFLEEYTITGTNSNRIHASLRPITITPQP